MHRRTFIKKSFLTTTGLGVFAGIYAWQIEPFMVEFVHRKLPLHNLPKKLKGKTLIQISDIHVGNRFNYQYIIKAFKETQKLKPDFVVYTGDYITFDSNEQFKQLKSVMEFSPKGELGTLGILGNHDYGINWNNSKVAGEIQNILESQNISILRNTSQNIEGLNFIGFDDMWGTNFNPEKAINTFENTSANIVLCHNPDICDLKIWNDFNGYILSGHTHGGQVKPPFFNPPLLPVKNKQYSAGEYQINSNTKLYINRAIGHLWQVRFNVRPEITVFKLT